MTTHNKINKFLKQKCFRALRKKDEQELEEEIFDDETWVISKNNLVGFVDKIKN